VKIAHISDLHFSCPTIGLSQFFSKRWIGNLNFFFSRKKMHLVERLSVLPHLFKEQGVTHVIISGDVSTTSQKREFREAASFAATLSAAGMEVFVVPGNHDHYTKAACKNKLFYDFFDPTLGEAKSPFNLKTDRMAAKRLDKHTWLVALDTALATSLVSSRGLFSEEMEEKLETLLAEIPASDRVILLNHFPLFHHENPRKILVRAAALRNIIQRFPCIKLYLHGHTHRHCIANLQSSGYPVILDSGSTTHKNHGSWHTLTFDEKGCHIDVFQWKNGEWMKSPESVHV
jgi:Predicted phosphohydrolases